MENDNIFKSRKKTILIIGINSFLGSNFAEFFKQNYRVVGTYFNKKHFQDGVLTLPCNVVLKDQVQLVMYAFKPDFVFYCVGLNSLQDCYDSNSLSDALNSTGLFNVAEISPRYNARVIYFSSQYLFSGANKNFNEVESADVICQYGKSQATAEFYLQKSSLNYLIFRCCKLYGRSIGIERLNFFEQLQERMFKGQSIVLDNFLFQGHLDVIFLAMIVKMCIEKNFSNRLIHVCSQDTMSYYEFAKAYCEIFSQSEGLISPGKWQFPYLKGIQSQEKLYFKLDVSNLEGLLKIKMPTITESIEMTYKRLNGNTTAKDSNSNQNKGEGISFI